MTKMSSSVYPPISGSEKSGPGSGSTYCKPIVITISYAHDVVGNGRWDSESGKYSRLEWIIIAKDW